MSLLYVIAMVPWLYVARWLWEVDRTERRDSEWTPRDEESYRDEVHRHRYGEPDTN